jgi:hypothetical protein
VIGLVAMLVCLISLLNAKSGKLHLLWFAMALAAYALAATGKEVFVPLPLVLLAITTGTLTERLRRIWPFFLITLLYLGYRSHMLGSFDGSWPVNNASLLANTPEMVLKLPFDAFVNLVASALITGLLLSLLGYAALRKKVHWPLVCTAAIALIIPLSFLSPFITGGFRATRWFLLAAWFFSIFIALGLARVDQKSIRRAATIVFAALVPLLFFQLTLPKTNFWKHRGKLAHDIWKAQNDRFYLMPAQAGSFKKSGVPQWRYLSYLIKGKPGTFVAFNKDVLNWLPQKGKQAMLWHFKPKPIKYPATKLNIMSPDKVRSILDSVTVNNGQLVMKPPLNGSNKYRIYLFQKPFYIFQSYRISKFPAVLAAAHDTRKAGIQLALAQVVIGHYINGEWRYTPPINYERLRNKLK